MTKDNAPESNIAPVIRSYVERIEKLEDEKRALSADIREVRREAKSNGLDPKTLTEMVKLRRIHADKRAEMEFNRDTYLRALGLTSELA